VQVIAYDIQWDGGKSYLGKKLNIEYNSSVSEDIDQKWLQDVLDFNVNSSN